MALLSLQTLCDISNVKIKISDITEELFFFIPISFARCFDVSVLIKILINLANNKNRAKTYDEAADKSRINYQKLEGIRVVTKTLCAENHLLTDSFHIYKEFVESKTPRKDGKSYS